MGLGSCCEIIPIVSDLPSSTPAGVTARRHTRRLLWIPLMCTIAICFVLDILWLRKLPSPSGVSVVVNDTQASVVALTAEPFPLCIVAISRVVPPLAIDCDWSSRRVHLFELTLPPKTDWHILLGFLWRWRARGASPVGGLLADPSLPEVSLPRIHIASKGIKEDLTLALPGTILAPDGTPEAEAVVIAEGASGNRSVVRADRDGNFTLRLTESWMSDETEIVIWGENGYVRIPQPIEILVDVPQVIRLQPYAKK